MNTRHLPVSPRSVILTVALVLTAPLLVLMRWQLLPPASYSLDMGDPATAASHFYGVEHSPEKAFRWSRELSAVSLPALGSSQQITITLNPARPAGEPLPTVRVKANGREVGHIQTRAGWSSYTLNLGPGLSPDARIVIDSDTFYPGKGDRRSLGVAVSGVVTAAAANRLGIGLPPLLWLLLAPLFPMLGFLCCRPLPVPSRARTVVPAFLTILPMLWTVVVPVTVALPYLYWAAGLATLLCMLWGLYRSSAPHSRLVARLSAVGQSKLELPAVGLLVGLLAMAQTWPLPARMATSMPGWPGDNFAFLYKLWWFRTALVEQHISPFFDPGSYAPFGFNLGQGEPTLLNTLPGAAIGSLTSDIVSYNLLALVSFVVAAIGGYLLVREVSSSKLAGLLGGLAVAFCPYRMSQFAGHLQMLGTGWIALAFYFLERLLKTGRVREGIGLGASLGLAALSAWYYAYMVGLALAVYFLFRLWTLRGSSGFAPARIVRGILVGVFIFLIMASPVAVPSLQLWAQGGLTHSAKAADEHSAAPLDYLLPNPLQPLWGEAGMRAHAEQNVIESALYPGLVVVAIAVAGGVMLLRSRRNVPSEMKTLSSSTWLVLGGICFLLSLGLTLHDANGQVKLAGGGVVPLPGQLLYDWLPLYSSMRAFARFGVLVMLCAAALMGIGWTVLLRSGPSWLRSRPVFSTTVAAALILLDFWTGPYAWGTSRVESGATDAFLAAQPSGLVMQMPLASSQSGPALYSHVLYGKPIAYGYETFEPPEWSKARPALEAFPADASLDVLKSWGVRYIVVSGNAYGADWPGTLNYLKSLPGMRNMMSFTERGTWDVDPQVLDARPDMEEYAAPNIFAVFELLR